MDNPIQNDAEMKEQECEKSFASTQAVETKEGMNMSMKDPDMMLSMVVLLLACLALAALAHVFV